MNTTQGFRKTGTVFALAVGATVAATAPSASLAQAAEVFPAPVYVSLRDDAAVVAFPGGTVWAGGPAMLYTALTPDGKVLMVTSPASGNVYAFDAATGEQVAVVATGEAPKGVKITPDGREAWVSNEAGNTISVVDLGRFEVVATIPTEKMPHNVRFSADGKTGYVTLQGGAGLGVIDTAKREVVEVIPVPGITGPHNLDLSADGKTAWVRDVVDSVAVLDLETREVKKVIRAATGHAGIDVLPNGRYVVTGAIGDTVVTVIDPATLEVVKRITVGLGPHGVRASADSRWIYATITSENKVVVIDADSLEVAAEYPVGKFPFWAAVRGNY